MSTRRFRSSDFAERFPGLDVLCSSYLYQDWDFDYGTPQAAVYAFCAAHAHDAMLQSASEGLLAVLSECPDEDALYNALDPMGFNYGPRPGQLRPFLSWARDFILDAREGAEIPRTAPPVPMAAATPEGFLLRFPHMRDVGSKYFGRESPYDSPADAYEAYTAKADPNEEALTFAALNMLDRYIESDERIRELLAAAGWCLLPGDGHVRDFIRYAVNLTVLRANQRWHDDRELPYA